MFSGDSEVSLTETSDEACASEDVDFCVTSGNSERKMRTRQSRADLDEGPVSPENSSPVESSLCSSYDLDLQQIVNRNCHKWASNLLADSFDVVGKDEYCSSWRSVGKSVFEGYFQPYVFNPSAKEERCVFAADRTGGRYLQPPMPVTQHLPGSRISSDLFSRPNMATHEEDSLFELSSSDSD